MDVAKSLTVNTRHFAVLDALRGISAVMVVLFHFPIGGMIYRIPCVRYGWMFVDFFFVLSGFVMAHSYGARMRERYVGLREFMFRRLGRIYPMHLVTLATLVGFEVLHSLKNPGVPTFGEARTGFAILTNLALLQAFGIHATNTWNGISWSIAAEMWAYLLFGLAFKFVPRQAVAFMLGLGLMCFFAMLKFSAHGLDATYDWGFARGIMGFALGVGAYSLFQLRVVPSGTLAEFGAIAATLVAIAFLHDGKTAYFVLPVFALLVIVFASEKGRFSQWIAIEPLLYVGKISYSLYMTQTLTLTASFAMINWFGARYSLGNHPALWSATGMPVPELLTIAMSMAGIWLAGITYRFVEVPARDYLKAFRMDSQTERQLPPLS